MWYYNDVLFEEIPEGIVGYVYLITNLLNNRKYIGKKTFISLRQNKSKEKRKNSKSNQIGKPILVLTKNFAQM